MGFYDDPDNVRDYLEMAEGYDGAELIAWLAVHLPEGASVLELGTGPGKDLAMLSRRYRAIGSDVSTVFLERYRAIDPDADLVQLDAVTLATERTFDCIYSNKVLHHLTRDELRRSLGRQAEVLNDGGLLAHAFWYGEGEELHHGLRFTYYTEETLSDLIGEGFETVEVVRYEEMEPDDSLWVMLRKR